MILGLNGFNHRGCGLVQQRISNMPNTAVNCSRRKQTKRYVKVRAALEIKAISYILGCLSQMAFGLLYPFGVTLSTGALLVTARF